MWRRRQGGDAAVAGARIAQAQHGQAGRTGRLGERRDPVFAQMVRGEIKRDVASFASSGNGGLILTASALAVVHRELIIALAAQYKLPAVYYRRLFVTSGGLISYGYIAADHFRRAATYVDRILKGEKPADLPVQAPTKYILAINLKTAKALGLEVPLHLQQLADEVVE